MLDKSVWRAWTANNTLLEQQAAARRVVAVKCASVGILLATSILWEYTSGYDLWIRFGVSLGGLVVLFQALRLRHYALAAAFALLILIYNPLVATFPFTGPGPFTFVLSTTLPFAASLIWLRPGKPAGGNTLTTAADAAAVPAFSRKETWL
jgi:hypothetical protein